MYVGVFYGTSDVVYLYLLYQCFKHNCKWIEWMLTGLPA